MRTHISKSPAPRQAAPQKAQDILPMQLWDNRPEARAEADLQDQINASARVRQAQTYQNSPLDQQKRDPAAPFQADLDAIQGDALQLKADSQTLPSDGDLQTSNPIQMMKPEELAAMGDAIDTAVETDAQEALSSHLWQLHLPEDAKLFIVGTVHANTLLVEMAKGQKQMANALDQDGNTPVARLLKFISTTDFDQVYTEISAALPALESIIPPLDLLEEPVRKQNLEKWKAYQLRKQQGHGLHAGAMDDVLASLAIKEKPDRYHALETEATRSAATTANYKDAGGQAAEVPQGWEARLTPADNDALINAYAIGNEKQMWAIHAAMLKNGLDPQGIEARNAQWVAKLDADKGKYEAKSTSLWIVGASHIPGLMVRFRKLGLKFEKVVL